MINKIKNNENLTNFVIDLIVRISVLEKILIEKKLVSKEDLVQTTNDISKELAKNILKNAGITENVEAILSEFDKK